MKLLSKKYLLLGLFWLSLALFMEPIWGFRVGGPDIDKRIRNADVIVVGKLIKVQENHWMIGEDYKPKSESFDLSKGYNWGVIKIKEILKSPKKGQRLRGMREDWVNLIYRGSKGIWREDIDFSLELGTEGIWLLHESSQFEQSLFGIGFYYINFKDECLDMKQLSSFRKKYAEILD